MVVVPTPTDPMGIFKSTQEYKTPGAVKEHTNEVRGGGRDPGVLPHIARSDGFFCFIAPKNVFYRDSFK